MKTNYQKLSLFEIAAIGLIAVGLVLIGLILFTNLSSTDQKRLTAAVQIFDLHEEVGAEARMIAFLFQAQHEFYEEFYTAFSQIALLPAGDAEFLMEMGHQTALLVDQFAQYSDQIAINYNWINQPAEFVPSGQVAGVAITNEYLSPPVNNFQVYEPPRVEWQQVFKLLTQQIN